MASSASTAKYNLFRESLKSQTTSSASITNHRRRLREGLETQPKSTSSALTTNHRRRLREGLETLPVSTASTSLVIDSDITDVTGSSIEPSVTSYALWRGHRCRLGISDSIPAARSLCEYTWEVVACMVLMGKGRLGPDIWPETPEQAESTKDMIRLIWGKEAHRQCRGSETKGCPLSFSDKEARFVGPLYCYGHLVANLNIDFGFYHGL